MKHLIRGVFLVFLLVFIGVSVFFLWASSPTLKSENYSKLTVNTIETIERKDTVFSLVTYNIGYLGGLLNSKEKRSKSLFDNNLKRVLGNLKLVNPDIVVLQEIDYDASRSYHKDQEKALAELGYNFVARTINWDERYVPYPYWPPSVHFGKTVSGQSILSKFELKDQERYVLDRVESAPFYRKALYLDRLAQVVKVVINNVEIVLINVHLEAFDKPTRVKQFHFVLNLFERYSKNNPTILLGDFNSEARDKDAIIKQLFSRIEIGNVAFTEGNPENTFDSRMPSKRIDYIFYTKKHFKNVSGSVLSEFGDVSDHLPIEMRFMLKKQ